MKRRAEVVVRGAVVGELHEEDDGYSFAYTGAYLRQPHAQPVSLTLPLRAEPFRSAQLPAFFNGLLAEGMLAETQCRSLRIDEKDSFGRLLATCRDTIGAVTIQPMETAT